MHINGCAMTTKAAPRVIFATGAVVLTALLLREAFRPSGSGTGSAAATAAMVPAQKETRGETSATLAREHAKTLPPSVSELAAKSKLTTVPKTVAELNEFADGDLPLPEKMEVLGKLMKEASPAIAREAAVRSLFIVRNPDYVSQLRPLILANSIKPEAMDVLGLNLYDRPMDMMLNTWALIREQPEHPLFAAASDGLTFHLGDKAGAPASQMTQVIHDHMHRPPAP